MTGGPAAAREEPLDLVAQPLIGAAMWSTTAPTAEGETSVVEMAEDEELRLRVAIQEVEAPVSTHGLGGGA